MKKRNLNSLFIGVVGTTVLALSLWGLLAGQTTMRIVQTGAFASQPTNLTFKLELQSASNSVIYVLQSSTNLINWQTVVSGKSLPGTAVQITDIAPTNRAMFFRVHEFARHFIDTNAPTWTNGTGTQLTITPPSSVGVSWVPAVDDIGIAQYRLFVNGVLVTNVSGSVLSYQFTVNLHQPTYIQIQAVDASDNTSSIFALALLPGDDILAVYDIQGRLFTFYEQTNGVFVGPNQIYSGNAAQGGVVLADFDRDGILDIVAGGATGNTLTPYFFKGIGDGTFAKPVAMQTAPGANGYMMGATVGDFDGDGNLDFVCDGNERYVFFYWGNGDGTFNLEIKDWGCCGRGLVGGDFDENGREDLARGTYSDGKVRLFLSNGDRTFTETNQAGAFGSDPYGLVTADFDEDGHLDIIQNSSSSGNVVFYKGAGDGTFTPLGTNGPWANLNLSDYAAMSAFDYLGTGHLDLVMATYSGHSVYLFPGNGDGTFNTNRLTLTTSVGNALGIAAPPAAPRADVNISPIDPVINLNGTITYRAVGTGVSSNDFFRWSFGDQGTNLLAWTFGTNDPNMGPVVSHQYTNEGRYLTRLWHTDARGIQSVRGTWATIKAQPPVANPGGPYLFGSEVATQAVWYATLDGSASTDDFGIATYTWNFGDGTIVTTNVPTIFHGWTNFGVWNVSLTVMDTSRQTDTKSTTVTFTNGVAPTAVIDGLSVVDETHASRGIWSTTFFATNSTDPYGIWKYAWNFGNGQTATGPIGPTTYNAVGTNVVSLTVTGNDNQTNSTNFIVVIKANGLPVPIINGPHVLPVTTATNGLWFGAWDGLSSTDDTGIYIYNWNFGDGTAAGSGSQITHNYSTAGVYPLRLTVTDNGNQSVTATQTVVVVAGNPPVARITASTLTPEGAQPVTLSGATSTSDNGIYLYTWFLPPRQFNFAGQFLDPNQWQAFYTTQNGKLSVTGQNNWGVSYFFSIGTLVQRGASFQGQIDTPATSSVANALVGLKNLNTASGHENQYPYAFYFGPSGDVHVFINGGDQGQKTNYVAGTSYDFKIVTKPNAGAQFFLRPTGSGVPFALVYDTSSGTDSTFSFGADVYGSVFGFENFAVDGVVAFGRDQVKPIFPGGTVTLQVVDSGLLTNSTSITITPLVGSPPTVVINGPTNGQSGVELPFTGYGSGDDYGIATYTWDFGDGSLPTFGPAVSHSYSTAGTYTNTLTVMDYADQTASASMVVTVTGSSALVHVPWLIINGIEQSHEVYSGKTNTLKAVVRGISAPFTNVWDYGDGTGTVTNYITNSAVVYNVEATHAYTAGDGTPFYAVVTVYLTNGSVLQDTYPLVVRAKTLEVEEKVAIDEGLWNLQKAQNRFNLDTNTTAGRWDSSGTISASASSVQAFGVNGHLMTDDPTRDPYVDTVRRGVNYLLSQLIPINIGLQPYGDPDGNHNGIALQANSGQPIYETGPILDALVAVGRPELIAPAGGANVKGRTLGDIVQDLVDMFCWGQYDDPTVGGGWRYGWNQGPDNSASQWGAIGMFPAENFWGSTVPAWVKARNLIWLIYSEGQSGFGYTGPGDGVATTPSALVQMGFDGIATTNSLWTHGEDFLANNWASAQNIIAQNNIYANYAIAKGLRAAFPQPVHNLALTGKDWFNDPVNGLARVTIDHQSPAGAPPGSWTSAVWADGPLASAWSILILSSSLFQQGPVAVINVSPNPSAIGYPVVFDARGSYHKHPGYKIVEFRWVFDSSKGVDFNHPDAVGPLVTNVFGSLSTNTVSLQVGDNSTPQLFDVASVAVQTTIPPYPPTADAGGPYVACAGQAVHLDGSGSFCVDASTGNFIQSYDWEVNYQVPVTFNQGVTGPKPVLTNGYPNAGAYQIGLRVKNANSLVYTNFFLPDETADAFTTVYVYNRLITDLRVRPKATKAQLTWTKVGDYAVIVRSQAGPDHGFTQVGQTDSSYATFLDTTIDYNNEYYYRVYAYQNGNPNALGVSDPVFVVSPPRNLDEHAPRFQSTPSRVAKVDQLYEVTLDAVDPENKPKFFSLLSGPTNMTVNATSGLVDFTPTADQIGNQFLSFQVSNTIGRDVLSFTLFVFPATNYPPVVNVNGPYAALIGQPIQFSSAGTSDPDNNPLRLYWNFGDGSTSTNANPVHTYGGVGDYLVSLFANDGYGGTTSAQTHAQITRPNVPPVAVVSNGPNFTVRLGETLTLNGSASFSPIGNPIIYTWVWGDGSTTTNAPSVATHLYGAGGPYAGSLTVADNRGGQNTYHFQVTMAAATLPPVVAMTISNNPAFIMATVTFDATGTVDPQGDPMTFWWDFGDHYKTTGPLVTHFFQQITNFNVVLTVSNSHNAFSVSNQIVQVVDAPPIFTTTPPLMTPAGKLYSYTPTVTDLAGAAVTFQLVTGPKTMSCDTNTGTLSWVPGTNNIGPNAIDLLATDANGGATHQTFTLVVTTPLGPQIDLAPTHIEMSNVVVDAQSLALSGTVTVYFQNNGTDPVPVPFTVSVFVDNDQDGTFSTNGDTIVGYGNAPANFPAGAGASIEMTVFGQALFKDCPFYAFVDSQKVVTEYNEANNIQRSGFDANTNQPPVIDLSAASLQVDRSHLPSSAVLTARLGNSGLVAVPTNVPVSFYDGVPQGGGSLIGIAHSTEVLKPGMYEELSVTWQSPTVTNHTIYVVADDPGNGVFVYSEIGYANNSLHVDENLAAILPPIADAGQSGGVYLGDTVQLNGSGSKDPQSRPLTYAWSFFSIPIGSQAKLTGTNTVSPSFKTDLAGDYVVQLSVNNGLLNSTNTAIATITGIDTNVYSPPKITSVPSFLGIVSVPYRYQVVATDPQNGTLTYRLPQGPPGMTISANAGLVQWTPTNAGSFLVQVAADGRGGSFYQGYTLTVIPFTNLPPQFTSTPIFTTAPTSNYAYTAVATSPVGNSVNYSLTQNPPGMGINGVTGLISWTPTASQVGGFPVTVTANDLHGAVATQSYTLVVFNGGAGGPQVATIPDQTVTAPAAFATISLDNYVVDVNYPANQITWKVSGTNLLNVIIDSNRVATISYPAGVNDAEQITFLATDPSGLSGYSSPLLTVVGNASPPVAAIANLDPNNTTSISTGSFNLLGTADDPGVPVPVAYRIGLYDSTGAKVADETPAPVDAGGWHEGRVPAGGSLGNLDFTMVRNGSYTLLLEVQANGEVATATAQVAIDTPLKIGQVTFAQQDLILPVQGVGLQVVRKYDSFNPTAADFGYSWTYNVADIGLTVDDQRVQNQDAVDGTSFSLRVGGSWDVTLTMPDTGRRVTFRFSLFQGSFTAQAVWTPPSWVRATLVPTISSTLVTLPGMPPIWQAAGEDTDWQAFDWPGFVLTLQNGTQFLISRQDQGQHFYATDSGGGFVHAYTGGYLTKITQPTGEHTDFVRNGIDLQNIVQFNATNQQVKSILFQRDSQHRINAVYTPEHLDAGGNPNGPASVSYTYDALNNLVTASKLTDASNPIKPVYSTFKYLYADPQFPHLLTEIDDPRGIPVLRAQFDSVGRLIGTLDAYGHLTSIQHNPAGQTTTVFDRVGNPTQLAYDQQGNVISRTDPLGNTTTLTYDANNRNTSITDPLGHTTSFAYDANGNINQMTDALGNKISMTISPTGIPSSGTDPLGHTTTNILDAGGRLTASTDPLGNVTRQTYDGAGNMTDFVDPSGHTTAHLAYTGAGLPSQISNVAGQALNLTYDASGHVTSHQSQWINPANSNDVRNVTSSVEVDYAGRTTNSVDALGRSLSRVYDQLNDVIQTTDFRGNSISNSYDADGNLIESRDSTGLVTRTVYDANDREVLQMDAHQDGKLANGTQLIYDAVGRLISTIRLSNVVVAVSSTTIGGVPVLQSSFVSAGGVISSNYSAYDAAGRQIALTDTAGQTTRFEYDAAGHKTAVIDPLGNREIMDYDAAGHNIAIHDPLGNETDFLYDANGRLTKTVFQNGSTVSKTYTASGQPDTQTDAFGNVRKVMYDNLGVPNAIMLPQTHDPESGNALTNPVFSVTFDANRNLQQMIDAKGRITSFTYDQFSRRTSRTLPLGQVEQVAYDAAGDVSRVTDFDGQSAEFQYDGLGRAVARDLYPVGSSTPAETVGLKYDELGRVIEMDEPRGATRFFYDQENRVIQVASPEGTVNYAYNSATGWKTRTWTASSDTHYGYDALARLQTITAVKRNGQVLSIPEVTTYTYTPVGNRESTILPNGVKTLYSYDQNSRLIGLQHIGTNGAVLMSFAYQYNVGNRRTNAIEIVTGPDGVFHTNSISYAYDELNRLVGETAKDLGDSSGYQANYTYDLVGNRLRRALTTAGKTLTTYYAYDANDRLLLESNVVSTATSRGASFRPRLLGPDGRPVRVLWDPMIGEVCFYALKAVPYCLLAAFLFPAALAPFRRRRTVVLTFSLNAHRALLPRCLCGFLAAVMVLIGFDGRSLANQAVYYAALTTDTWGLDGSVTTYQYDANGSVLKKVTTGPKPESDTFQYTLLKQLAVSTRSYTSAGNQVVETCKNTYDYDGIRVRNESATAVNGALESSRTNLFLIDPANLTGFAQVLEELPAFGAMPTVSYTIGNDIVAQSTDPSGQAQYLLKDGHDSTRQLASSLGTVTDYYGYDAYGVMLGGNPISSNPSATKMLYSGEQFDSGLGLYNQRARFYDPGVGRFTTMDTYEGSPQDPQSLHKYTYCLGDPINSRDPSGHESFSEVLTTVFIIGVLAGIVSSVVSYAVYGTLAPDAVMFGIGASVTGSGAPAAGVTILNVVAQAVSSELGDPTATTLGGDTAGAILGMVSVGKTPNFGGKLGIGASLNVGGERLYTTVDRSISSWTYYGPGINFSPTDPSSFSSFGSVSGTATVYAGVCWNVTPNWSGYAGPFYSFSLGAGSAWLGWAVSYFFADGNAGQNGFNVGLTFNVPAGKGKYGFAGIGISYLIYHGHRAGDWDQAGYIMPIMLAVPGVNIWTYCIGWKWGYKEA